WDSSAKKKQLCDWLETKVQDCIDSLNIEVSYSFHSNLNSASVNELINNISQEVVSANDRKK
ncbi:hypothetical protein RZ541_18975, partial [Acinetobacter baumannii]|nr:hypothetical protein [Acinetobacter baumannii]